MRPEFKTVSELEVKNWKSASYIQTVFNVIGLDEIHHCLFFSVTSITRNTDVIL